MHIYVLRIAESGADMGKAKISGEVAQEQNRNGFLDYCEEEPLEDDARNMLLESYNHKLFIPGKDDKSFRLVKSFKTVLGDIKLKGIKALLEEMTPENFHIKIGSPRIALSSTASAAAVKWITRWITSADYSIFSFSTAKMSSV